MNQGRIEKLKQLLRRVEQRRAEPRLVAVAGVRVLESANTNVATAPAPTPPSARLREAPPLELAPRPASPIEEAFADRAPSSIPPPAPRVPSERPAARAPSEAPATRVPSEAPAARVASEAPAPTSLPPAAHEAPVTELRPPTSTVPPAMQEAVGRAQTEVLPPVAPVPTRIAPSPAQPFDSAVQVTSSPRIDQPKTFGELLEVSLALRPRASTPPAG